MKFEEREIYDDWHYIALAIPDFDLCGNSIVCSCKSSFSCSCSFSCNYNYSCNCSCCCCGCSCCCGSDCHFLYNCTGTSTIVLTLLWAIHDFPQIARSILTPLIKELTSCPTSWATVFRTVNCLRLSPTCLIR